MATYSELYLLHQDYDLLGKIAVAVAIWCEVVRTEDPGTANHANRVAYANGALVNPDGTARRLIWIMLAQNAANSVAQIQGASDAAIYEATRSAIEFAVQT